MADLDASAKETLEKEILPFLNPSARVDLKSISLEYFLGMTGTKEGRKFIGSGPRFLEAIVSLTSDENRVIAKDAYLSLVNLATEEEIAWNLLNMKKYPDLSIDLLKYLLNSESEHADMVAGILANLTRTLRCAARVADSILQNTEETGMDKIIQVLCNLKSNPKANLHHLGSLLSNLTQVASIRREIMNRECCVIQRLVPFTTFKPSLTRRGGIVGALKNCCFESEYHDWLMGEQVDILPCLLLPLAGPEEFDEDDMDRLPIDLQYLPPDKERESDPDIRRMLVEAITQLCATKQCRLKIKEKNTYIIMRELHKWEKDKANSFAIMNLIDILIGDEPSEGMENLHDVQVPKHYQKQFEEYHAAQKEIEETDEAESDTKK